MTSAQEIMDPAVLEDFSLADLMAGDAIFTVTVLRAHDTSMLAAHFTYRVTRREHDDGRVATYVKVLTGPDNLSDYRYAGMLDGAKFRTTRASAIGPDAPSVKLLVWLVKRLAAGQSIDAVEVLSASRCLRCGRPLTASDSIKNRYGPYCAGQMGI